MHFLLVLFVSILVCGFSILIPSSDCSDCGGEVCSLQPDPRAASPFCYQSNPANTTLCLENDPLVRKSSAFCNTCIELGFPKFIQNDPIFTDMELWNVDRK